MTEPLLLEDPLKRIGIWIRVPKRLWKLPKIAAITLWPFVFCHYDYWEHKGIIAHENYHWLEAKSAFVIPWYIAYVVLLPFTGGGRKHPLEKNAYAREDTINTMYKLEKTSKKKK